MYKATPLHYYVVIKIARKQQKDRKTTIGSIIIPETQQFMMYNMQAGEIIAISPKAKKHFPELEIGHTLICHHFVEGENEYDAKEDHLLHQDESFNYYAVTCCAFYTKGNEAYGVWDGKNLIPNRDYIFLEYASNEDPKSADDYINSALHHNTSGIFTFKKWEESRETKAEKMKRLKSEIQELSKTGAQKSHIAKGIREKEFELEQLSVDINAKSYEAHTVVAYHPSLQVDLPGIKVGSKIYSLNIASQTTIEFMDKKYIALPINYIGGLSIK